MSQGGSGPFNWDGIDCPKFVDFKKEDSPQYSQSLESYFDTHKDSPPFTVREKLAALSFSADTVKPESFASVDHASHEVKGRDIEPQKPTCTPTVSGSDHAMAPLSNASPSLVYKPNYAHQSLKQDHDPKRVTKDQTSLLQSSPACRSTTAARLYCSNRPPGTAMSSLVSKFSNQRVHAGDNAKQACQASKVSQAENMKQAENAKERSLPHAQPRKPGQPLHAQNTKAASCSDLAMIKQACLSISTKTAAQPITVKQAIRASKVSQVENVKRRSLPHAEPRKPGQPLREQNIKAVPRSDAAMTKLAGLSILTKTAAQPITVKQAIRASKVSQVENVKRRSLPHVEPRKPGQPLREQNIKAVPRSDAAMTKLAGLSILTKTAAQPKSAKPAIQASKASQLRNVKIQSLPHVEPRKPGQPLHAQNTKALPCSRPVMTKQACIPTSTKTAAQPITAKPVIQASKASEVGNVKIRSLRHAEPRKPGQPLRAHNTKAMPCSRPAMTKQAGHSTSTKTATQLITAKPVIQASKASQVGNVKIRSLRHAEPRKPGQPLRAHNTKAMPCSRPAMTKQAGHSTSTKTAAQPITAQPAIQASKASHVGNVKRRNPPHAEPRKPSQPLRTHNMNPPACSSTAVASQTGLSRAPKIAAQPIAATATRTRPAPITVPWRYVGRATMNSGMLNYNWDNKTRAPATKSNNGTCGK